MLLFLQPFLIQGFCQRYCRDPSLIFIFENVEENTFMEIGFGEKTA
jgi:hypothetical protein